MKKNKNTRIIGKNVILVPYKKEHVERYHEWMKNPELQHFTCSEPLTIEEEYKMQKSWEEDEKKYTFIILDKDICQSTANEIDSMIGDTNLFFNSVKEPRAAEIEVMIADLESQGKRRGWEATILMLLYGIETLNVDKYQAKITLDNKRSIKMFEKLQFSKVEISEVFQEITLEKNVDEEWLEWLHSETPDFVREELYIK